MKLPGRGCRALGATCSPACAPVWALGAQQPRERLFPTWPPPPRRLALLLFSSSGLWNLLRILSPQDEESRCRSPHQAPKHPPPKPRASGSLLLHSPVTTAMTGDRAECPPPPARYPGSRPVSGRGGWVSLRRTRLPSRGATRAGLSVPGCGRAGLEAQRRPSAGRASWEVLPAPAGPSPAFSKCSPSALTVGLHRPWGHISQEHGGVALLLLRATAEELSCQSSGSQT